MIKLFIVTNIIKQTGRTALALAVATASRYLAHISRFFVQWWIQVIRLL